MTTALSRVLAPFLAALMLCGCAASREQLVISTELVVRKVAPGIWLHVTTDDGNGGPPANGLLVESPSGLVLIDTGWNAGATEHVLGFAENTLKQRVTQAVVTHAHPDRAGGLRALLDRNIPVTLHTSTAAQLEKAGVTGPWKTFDTELTLLPGKARVDLFFPGPGHSPDNVVVWVGRERLLFAGCLIKAEDEEDLGDVSDADLSAWPSALARVRARFPSARTVVPGHGDVGGRGLFQHTTQLLEGKASAPR